MLKIDTKNSIYGEIKNFILGHCIFALKMSLPIVVRCIDTKPRNSS